MEKQKIDEASSKKGKKGKAKGNNNHKRRWRSGEVRG